MDHTEQIDHTEHAYLSDLCPLCDHSPCISGAGKGGCEPSTIECEPEPRLVNCYAIHGLTVHTDPQATVTYWPLGIADGDPGRALTDALRAGANGLLICDVRTGERWYVPCGPIRRAAERASIEHLHAMDAWHQDQGHVMCGGVCSRWYEPDDLDDFGTCRSTECLRAAVNP